MVLKKEKLALSEVCHKYVTQYLRNACSGRLTGNKRGRPKQLQEDTDNPMTKRLRERSITAEQYYSDSEIPKVRELK